MARPPAQGRQERNQISAWEELPGPHATNPPTSLRDVERFLKDVLKDVGKRGASPERRWGIKKIIIIYNYFLLRNVFQEKSHVYQRLSGRLSRISQRLARKYVGFLQVGEEAPPEQISGPFWSGALLSKHLSL